MPRFHRAIAIATSLEMGIIVSLRTVSTEPLIACALCKWGIKFQGLFGDELGGVTKRLFNINCQWELSR